MTYSKSEEAVLKTILYSDIFDFPLTKEEIWRFLISDKKISKITFEEAFKSLSEQLVFQDGFYTLVEKKENIKRRKSNNLEYEKKLKIANMAAKLLSYIPTISFIGLSGGVAVGNVKKTDDIDLFIITKKNTLFMTRFWILLLLEVKGLRRTRFEHSKAAANKICVNLLIDESAISWPSSKQDLYTAHEIVQVKPLFERGGMYNSFLNNNRWVKKYLPNSLINQEFFSPENNYYTLKFINILLNLSPIPLFVKFMQLLVIKKTKTNETVTDKILAFHPNDYRFKILKIMEKFNQSILLTKT